MNYTVTDGASLLGPKMKRFSEFDILRGILLLMMSVDHSPSSLRRITDQPLGFFSTAECFVFVSAFLAGLVFRKRAEKLGFAAARASSIHRAGRIYRAHLVTLAFAFVSAGYSSVSVFWKTGPTFQGLSRYARSLFSPRSRFFCGAGFLSPGAPIQ
jgi:hypothetical protein